MVRSAKPSYDQLLGLFLLFFVHSLRKPATGTQERSNRIIINQIQPNEGSGEPEVEV